MSKKIFALVFMIFGIIFLTYAEPENLKYFKEAYPQLKFESQFIPTVGDDLITVIDEDRYGYFFWANGKLLPYNELGKKDTYHQILYNYPKELLNPENFTQEDIDYINEYTSKDNRQNSGGVPSFFYDFVYNCATHVNADKQIVRISFLGKWINVNKKIKEPLKNVETKINELAKTDEEVATFLKKLSRTDGYNWREIIDSKKKSLHSSGIAVDILPIGWGQKNIYWQWRRDIDEENWMKLSLNRRWYPPDSVIKAFESEGFVYGGKWVNWDNMHFEYTPEILCYNDINED